MMRQRRRDKPWWRQPTLLFALGLLAPFVGFAGGLEGTSGLAEGLGNSVRLLWAAAPQMLVGFTLAGMITALVPPSAIGRWMGDEAGLKGVAIGLAAGALSPGGPYIVFPIAAALMNSGAGLAPMAGFLATRNLTTTNRLLVWDIPFLGAPFALARLVASLWLPLVSVVLVPPLLRLLRGAPQARNGTATDEVGNGGGRR